MRDEIEPGAITQSWSRRGHGNAPHLPVAPASDRSVWGSGGSRDSPTVASVLDAAVAERGQAWPALPSSSYLRFVRDGDRVDYEERLWARQRRLTRATVAAAETLDARWLDEVVDGVVAMCEQSTWCWPAHDDAPARGGALPDPTRPFLDLGAGEMVAQLAWIDHLMGPELEARAPGVRARIRHEADLRVFTPFEQRRDWHWLGLDGDVHNWSPWIQGNVLTAAVALLDGDRRERVVDLALRGIDLYVAALPADGAIDEGMSYWWNGACRALEAVTLVREAYAPVDLAAPQGLRATLDFPRAMHWGGDWFVSLADSTATQPPALPWHAAFRAASALGAQEAMAFALTRRDDAQPAAQVNEGLGRLLLAMTDARWRHGSAATPAFPRELWLPSIEVGIARERDRSPSGLAVALKGGHNDEHHNHLDVGSVIIALDGVPFVVDPGRPTYTRQTFGPDRYDIWTMRSDWHSVPAIGGLEQGVGRKYRANGARIDTEGDATTLELDLHDAYPGLDGVTWHRTVRLDRASSTVTLEERWTGALPAPTECRLVIAGAVTPLDGGAGVTTLAGDDVVLAWDPERPATWCTRELDDPILSAVWGAQLHRVSVTLPACGPEGGTFAVQVRRR